MRKECIELIFSGVLVITNIILARFNYKNLKLIKELSSPKPFLKPTDLTLDGFMPRVTIKNFGTGHAVNVKVKALVNLVGNGEENIQNVWVEYLGDNTIPYIPDKDNIVTYEYDGEDKPFFKDNMKISIEYENDSGAKGKVVWQHRYNIGIGNEFFIVEGR